MPRMIAPVGESTPQDGGDRDQTGDGTRGTAEHRRLAAEDPLTEGPGHRCHCRADEGVEEHQAGERVGFEAEPTLKPNQPTHSSEAADHHEGHVVRRHRHRTVARALADDQRAYQARYTGVDVHHGAARIVQGAELEEIALGVPDHARDRQVGEGEPQHREDQHRGELGAFSEAADRQRRGDGRERGLEGDEHVFGNRHALVKVAAGLSAVIPDRKSRLKSPIHSPGP